MCGTYKRSSGLRQGYAKDCLRGRIADPTRFWRLRAYVYARWERTRDLRRANQWRAIMEVIDKRRII